MLIVAYVLTAAYSAAQIRPSHSNSNGTSVSWTTDGRLVLSTSINITNRGWYALADFRIETSVAFANGTLIAHGGAASVTVPPGGTTVVPIAISIPLGLTGPAAALLTHDAKLPATTFANATFAGVFGIHLEIPNNQSWGAPFFGLNATAGTPALEPNGSVAIPVRVMFQDHSSIDDRGSLLFSVESSTGSTCATGSFPVDVPSKAGFDQTQTLFFSSSCDPHGGTLVSSYTTMGVTVSLPPESLP